MKNSMDAYLTGRNKDNNFNLLRFIAATMVLFGHSWPLTGFGNDPLATWFEVPAPHMAVDIFFAISGFLVTSSLFENKNFLAFVCARIFRIFPGLLVSLAVTVFVIGLYFTRLDSGEYLHNPEIYHYIWKNFMLIELKFDLPGVFENTPRAGTINGSLWTLPYEISMYLILAALGLLFYVSSSTWMEKIVRASIILLAVIGTSGLMLEAYGPKDLNMLSYFSLETWRFTSLFFLGASAFVLRRLIPMRRYIIDMLIVAVFVSKNIYFNDTNNNCLFFGVYSIFLVYFILYVAYIPAGAIRKFNKLGDYSYGIYIYAFPIQQAVYTLSPGCTPWQMFFYAFPVTLLLAVLSWHLIERPLLARKNIYKKIESWFGYQG